MSPLDRFIKKTQQIQDSIPPRKRGMERKRVQPDDDESTWLISYADLMTLLCAFFIMMFSMSSINKPLFEKVKKELSTHFGGDYSSPNAEFAKFITQIIQENGLEKETTIEASPFGVSIVFNSTVFFDTLSAYVREPGQEAIRKLIDGVYARQEAEEKKFRIMIEGHTDGRPILGGIYPSNWELSSARAASVVRLFLEKGFSSEQLMAVGYADTRPALANRTPAGSWNPQAIKKNRRVVIRILDPAVDAIPWESPEPVSLKNSASSAH